MNSQVKAQELLAYYKKEKVPAFEHFSEVCVFVTHTMIDHYDLHGPRDINYGYCFIWAFLVWSLWRKPEDITFVSDDGNHVIVKCGELYYDSESCEGKKSVRFFDINFDDSFNLNVKQMAWFWSRHGRHQMEFRRLVRHFYPRIKNVLGVEDFGVRLNAMPKKIASG